jgi:16S rRNA processing protein RimM
MTEPEYLLLGQILRPHGVRGELRMRILTAYPERIADLDTVYLGREPQKSAARAYRVEFMRMHQGFGLLKLASVDDRDAAERLRALFVMTTPDNAVPLEDDEVYIYELIGLPVYTDDGKTLGTLSEVLETGANDVYVVQSPQYGEVLIPALDETILKIDPDAGKIVVKLPEGLLPGTAEDA